VKTAVLLATMGGPASLPGVRRFLFNLFHDPAILRVPQPLRFMLAQALSFLREKKAQDIYKQMGGHSPILENTTAQAAALEVLLRKSGDYRCFVGMSYSPPFIKDAVMELTKDTPDHIIILPLYPQFSTTTTASVLRDVKKFLWRAGKKTPVSVIENFYLGEGFLSAQCETIEPELQKARQTGEPFLCFSAHGLPEKIVLAGDPYPEQCRQTAAALAKRLNLEPQDWVLCYQSRIGPVKWIGPSTRDEIDEKAKSGRAIVVVPISFVCEHAETVVELNLDLRQRALKAGAVYYGVAKTVGVKEAFIQHLATETLKINQKPA